MIGKENKQSQVSRKDEDKEIKATVKEGSQEVKCSKKMAFHSYR